jgi:predicted kinase
MSAGSRSAMILVTGCPGAGKTTFARHMASNHDCLVFETDDFLEQIYARKGGLTLAGDFTDDAMQSVYATMSAAVRAALLSATPRLVLAVGSFRLREQRDLFRDIARTVDALQLTLLVEADPEEAATRVNTRVMGGGRGPNAGAVREIYQLLTAADDFDLRIANRASLAEFLQLSRDQMESFVLATTADQPRSALLHQFEIRAERICRDTLELIDAERLRTWPPDRLFQTVRGVTADPGAVSVIPIGPRRYRVAGDRPEIAILQRALRDLDLRIELENAGVLVITIPAVPPSIRHEAGNAVRHLMTSGRDRVREARNLAWLAHTSPSRPELEAGLQKAADKWINAIDQMGQRALSDLGIT